MHVASLSNGSNHIHIFLSSYSMALLMQVGISFVKNREDQMVIVVNNN